MNHLCTLPDPMWNEGLLFESYDPIPSNQAMLALDILVEGINIELQKHPTSFLASWDDEQISDGISTLLFRIVFLLFATHRGFSWRENELVQLFGAFSQGDGDVIKHNKIVQLRDLSLSLHEEFEPHPHHNQKYLFLDTPFIQTLTTQNLISDSTFQSVVSALCFGKAGKIEYRELPIEQLGTIFERLLDIHIVKEKNTLFIRGTELRKDSGAHYTPRVLCDFLVAQSIASHGVCFGSLDSILNVRICDPAMGSGAFLLSACRYLARKVEELPVSNPEHDNYSSLIAQRCLFGVDRNPNAVMIAQLSLWLLCESFTLPFYFVQENLRCGNSLLGCPSPNIEPSFFLEVGSAGKDCIFDRDKAICDVLVWMKIRHCSQKISKTKKRAEKLILNELIQQYMETDGSCSFVDMLPSEWKVSVQEMDSYFHWHLEFPQIFSAPHRIGFDIILGNPPFVNCIRGNIPKEEKEFYKERFSIIHGSSDLSYYFLELASEIIHERGVIGLILPRVSLGASALQGFRAHPNRPKPTIIYSANHHQFFAQAAIKVVAYVFAHAEHLLVSNADSPVNDGWKQTDLDFSQWWSSFQHNWWAKFWMATKEANLPLLENHRPLSLCGFEVHGGLTTGDFYTIHVEEKEEGESLKLITSGGIDPNCSFWGHERLEQRFNKQLYRFPRVAQISYPKALERKLLRSRRPKIIVANLTKEVEAFLDEKGEYQGATATQTIFHEQDDVKELKRLCAQLHSARGNLLFHAILEYNAMHANISMEKSFLEDFPVSPEDR